MATEVGNIHIGLYVDVGESRRFTDIANVVEKNSRRMNSALGNTSMAVRGLRGQMSQSLQFRIAQNSLRDLTRATDATTQLRSAIVGLTSLTTGSLTGAFSAAYLVQTADKARLLSNQIKTVTSSSAELGAVQDSLFQTSQRTRSSYEATTTLYARMARATEHFTFSQEKLLRTTETIQKAFAIGGASPQEAQGAAIQLSQGIASDRFSGEEFRSVAENAPVLLKGIADSLGVNIGKLREMAHAGELTAQTVTEAILDSSTEIDAAFSKMVPTVAQSWTLLNNAILRYAGASDEAYGVTEKIGSAIAGLSENLEDVMYWVTRVTGGLGLLYAARKLTMSSQGFVAGVRENNAVAREQVAGFDDNGQAIRNRQAEIAAEMAGANKSVADAENAALAKHSTAVNAAKEKEFLAQRQINDLEQQRNGIVQKLGGVRAAQMLKLQTEIDLGRQRVRDDQLRVIQAQEAASAEERILRAKQAQALARSDQTVTDAGTRVSAATSRVADAQKAIDTERELAKVKLAGEIDARRQSLITNTQRLKGVQSQIEELRAVKDLSGFDEAYGKQYTKLLEQQQKAIISTGNLRKEIGSLEDKMEGISSGTASTRAISSAMTQHAASVRQAESAVNALAKAEATRAKVAAAPVGGKTLEARLAAEAKEIDRYQASVTSLQGKMQELRAVTETTFTGGGARKMVAEIDALDKKIVSAQGSLGAASAAVAASQSGNATLLAASLTAQEKAARQVNALQQEAANLLDAQVLNTQKLEAAQKRVNLLRRAGSGFLGAFGGAWGLGITVALVSATALMAKFAANAAESAQQSENITKQLRDMGYLAEDAAGGMGEFQKSLSEGKISKLQTELNNFQLDIKKTNDQLNAMAFDEAAPNAVSVIPDGWNFGDTVTGNTAVIEAHDKIRGSLKSIRDEMVSSKGMSDAMRKSLEDIALANPDLSSTTLQLISFGDRLNAIGKAVNDWVDSLKKLREEANKLPQDRFATSRTDAAKNQTNYRTGVDRISAGALKDVSLTEEETKIKAVADSLIKEADKAGEKLLEIDARVIASMVYKAEETKKWLKNLEDLDLKTQISELSEFDQKVVQTAQSFGLSSEEIKKYISEVKSGNLSGIPAKFKAINEALSKEVDVGFAKSLLDLKKSKVAERLPEIDRQVIELARSFGIGETEIDKFIKAISTGVLQNIPPRLKSIRDELQNIADIEFKFGEKIPSIETSRSAAAENQRRYEFDAGQQGKAAINDANLTEYEGRINSIMDGLISDAEKLGKTLLQADARRMALDVYSAENSSKAVSGFTDRIIDSESSGNNKARPLNSDGTRRSSAYGLGQFIEKTWLTLFKKHFPEEAATLTDPAILALRSNSDKSKALIDAYAKENAAILQKAGVSVDEVALQLAHFLGPQGAIAVLSAAPGTLAKDVLSAKAIKANPEVLGGNATVDDVIAYGQKRAGVDTLGTQKIEARESLDNALGEQQRMIDALLIETGIRQTLNPLVNDYGKAISTLEAAQKLLNVAQEEGTAAGNELKNVQQLLKGDFSSLTPEARAQAEAMLLLSQKTGEATAAGNKMEESQGLLKDRLQESSSLGKSVFGGIISDLRAGASAGDILSNVFDKLLDKMIEMSLTSIFDGGISGSGGGPLGGIFSGFLGLLGFDEGGFTGRGGNKEPKGVVHGNEFVFDAEATRNAGVANLYRMMDMLKGNSPLGLPGYEGGGFVGRMTMPSFDTGGYINDNSNIKQLSNGLREQPAGAVHVSVGVSVDENGNIGAYVKDIAWKEGSSAATAAVTQYDKTMPDRVKQINQSPRKR